MQRIDSHVHFWRIDAYASDWMTGPFAPLRRDHLPEHLAPRLAERQIDGAVFVQAQHEAADNDWVLGLADTHPWIRGVVGWLDLTADGLEAEVERLRANPRFVGLRHIVQAEPDDNWILRPDVQRGLGVLERHGVPYDLLFLVQHLPHAATVADRFPNLPLVIDHLAKPHIKAGRIDDWEPALREAARRDNVFCKLSGMVTEADLEHWQPTDLRPYIDIALDAFGPDRLMFGSDWPVSTVAGDYARVHDALVANLGRLAEAERDAIFGGTARRFYRLPG